MARKHYKITFKDRVVIYTVGGVNNIGHSVPCRVIHEGQMELMNLMLIDIAEPHFSCTEEEFYSRLTPKMLEHYIELKSKEFKVVKHNTT